MASRVSLLYPPYNGPIMRFSIKLLAFWMAFFYFFQFSGILVTQSITVCLRVKVVPLNLQREPHLVRHGNTEAHRKEHETFPSPPTPTPTASPPPPGPSAHLHQCNLCRDCTLVHFLVERRKKNVNQSTRMLSINTWSLYKTRQDRENMMGI